jgi:hypothetical protein
MSTAESSSEYESGSEAQSESEAELEPEPELSEEAHIFARMEESHARYKHDFVRLDVKTGTNIRNLRWAISHCRGGVAHLIHGVARKTQCIDDFNSWAELCEGCLNFVGRCLAIVSKMVTITDDLRKSLEKSEDTVQERDNMIQDLLDEIAMLRKRND